ncbi:hypothetical protein ACHAW6_008883 [Cyclotella cf. meneghiniana]
MDDDSASSRSVGDSCEAFISFQSIRDPSTNLERAICFSWPGIYDGGNDFSVTNDDNPRYDEPASEKERRKIVLSTLLEEDDIAPIFDGSCWAGTRLWGAAIRAIQYITGHLDSKPDLLPRMNSDPNERVSMIELGCGLGVPGMIFHLLGGSVVLTDQANILSQLVSNVAHNFPKTAVRDVESYDNSHQNFKIQAMPLTWSKDGISQLLGKLNRSEVGFDIVLNCDCVFEPLYGKSWVLLNEVINELLRVNPLCVVVTSVERRQDDGIDSFLEQMIGMEFVGSVEKVWEEKRKHTCIEIYVTQGVINE